MSHITSFETNGFDFVEMSSVDGQKLDDFLTKMGFQAMAKHPQSSIVLYQQGQANIVVNHDPDSHAKNYAQNHNCFVVSSFSLMVENAKDTNDFLVSQGAKSAGKDGLMSIPCVQGVGEGLIYLIDPSLQRTLHHSFFKKSVLPLPADSTQLTCIDHITANVMKGELTSWIDFYRTVFGFTLRHDYEVHFNQSKYRFSAISNDTNTVRLPLNEGFDEDSTVSEFLRLNKGSGIQHIAFQSPNIIDTVRAQKAAGIEFLTIPDIYYELVEKRLPDHGENLEILKDLKILIDGERKQSGQYVDYGLLFQIFTKMMISPVFFEVIQRRGNEGFGEGNVEALSQALELDRVIRGVLK